MSPQVRQKNFMKDTALGRVLIRIVPSSGKKISPRLNTALVLKHLASNLTMMKKYIANQNIQHPTR